MFAIFSDLFFYFLFFIFLGGHDLAITIDGSINVHLKYLGTYYMLDSWISSLLLSV